MIFSPTEIAGVWIIDLEKRIDERGFFARTWCHREFQRRGTLGHERIVRPIKQSSPGSKYT